MRPPSDDMPRVAQPRVSPPADYHLPPSTRSGDSSHSASHRLRALAALSGSLTDALAPEEAAALIERQALTALGAASAVVVTLGAFPPLRSPATPVRAVVAAPALVLVHAIGLPD